MMMRPIVRLIGLLATALGMLGARADAVSDAFDTVWESLWYQGGSPEPLSRWSSDIRVRVHGQNAAFHRERILDALNRVSRLSGIAVLDFTDRPGDAASVNLDIELVDPQALMDNMACYVRKTEVIGSVIRRAQMRMRENAVYYCVLHEAMHVMGIAGHPRYGTILSYFNQRVDRLTELDELMLKAWYSSAMQPGMTPFEALPVLTNAVVAAQGAGAGAARDAQSRFHAQVIQQMASFADGTGELPVVLKRSGTASTESIARGRTLMRAYLGLAYARGTLVEPDPRTAARWMERAARDKLPYALWVMGNYAERGVGQAASAADAYVWYGLAAAHGIDSAVEAQKRIAPLLTPEEVDAARKRMASFQ